jgi:hypothetical protein
MAKPEDISLVKNGKDFFVVIDGVRIARRGYPGTPQAGTWVSIEPGWEVVGGRTHFPSHTTVSAFNIALNKPQPVLQAPLQN